MSSTIGFRVFSDTQLLEDICEFYFWIVCHVFPKLLFKTWNFFTGFGSDKIGYFLVTLTMKTNCFEEILSLYFGPANENLMSFRFLLILALDSITTYLNWIIFYWQLLNLFFSLNSPKSNFCLFLSGYFLRKFLFYGNNFLFQSPLVLHFKCAPFFKQRFSLRFILSFCLLFAKFKQVSIW